MPQSFLWGFPDPCQLYIWCQPRKPNTALVRPSLILPSSWACLTPVILCPIQNSPPPPHIPNQHRPARWCKNVNCIQEQSNPFCLPDTSDAFSVMCIYIFHICYLKILTYLPRINQAAKTAKCHWMLTASWKNEQACFFIIIEAAAHELEQLLVDTSLVLFFFKWIPPPHFYEFYKTIILM